MALVLVLALCVAAALAHPHPEFPDNTPPGPLPDGPIITGTGDYRYEYQPQLLQLPASVQLRNGHGLAKDLKGNIYFTYESTSVQDDTRALLRFNPDGTNGTLLGKDNSLAYGTPHGLRISYEGNTPFLYHANNDHTIHKTTIDGDILWTKNVSTTWPQNMSKFWPFKPTDSIAPPNSDVVYVSDGYGSSYVHAFSTSTGEYANRHFGGKGTGYSPQQFNCPHGINFDPRHDNILLISDRANHRLQWVDLNGTHVNTLDMGPGTPQSAAGQLPCNVDVHGDLSLVPGLDGPVGILDSKGNVLSVLEVGKLLPKSCPHPHDAIMLDNKDVIVCCWAPGLLTYWKHIE